MRTDIRRFGRWVRSESSLPPVWKGCGFILLRSFPCGKLFFVGGNLLKYSIIKRTISAILCICSLLCCFGCTPQQEYIDPENAVIDASGNMLAIPEGKATIASVYAVSVPFIVALGLADNVVAINCKSRFWSDNVEALGKAGTVGRGVVDLEALASYNPTVLIHRSNDAETVKAVSRLNIDVLCIKAESVEDVAATLRLMGGYFGKEERAEEVISFIDAKFALVDSIVARIPQEERVTALTLGGELGRIAGGDMLQSWMIEKAGGIPVAAGIENNSNWAQVGIEKVFTLDPEYLFITSSTTLDYSVEDIYSDKTWSAMKCVEEENIYQIPAKIDSWDMPGVSCTIGTMWMLHKMYPEYFSADELQREIDEYYQFMFQKTFEPEYLGYKLDYEE